VKLKEYLLMYEPNSRVNLFAKNDLPIGSWNANLYLKSSGKYDRKLLKCEVLYEGLDNHGDHVVVINMKVGC